MNSNHELTGISPDLALALGQKLNRPITFKTLAFDGLITALKSHQIDLILSSMTDTLERRNSIDFTRPYAKMRLSALLPKASTLTDKNTLLKQAKKIVVKIGTTGETWCKKNIPQAQLITLDSDAACVLEVTESRVDAWIYDQVTLLNFHQQHSQSTQILLEPLDSEFWSIALNHHEEALKASLNQALIDLRQEGFFKNLSTKHLQKETSLQQQHNIPLVFDVD
jgi:polar amino acid transport system substrate-binding protein